MGSGWNMPAKRCRDDGLFSVSRRRACRPQWAERSLEGTAEHCCVWSCRFPVLAAWSMSVCRLGAQCTEKQQETPATPEAHQQQVAASSSSSTGRAQTGLERVVCFYLPVVCLTPGSQSGDLVAPSSVGCMYGTAACLSLAGRGTTEQPSTAQLQEKKGQERARRINKKGVYGQAGKRRAGTTTDLTNRADHDEGQTHNQDRLRQVERRTSSGRSGRKDGKGGDEEPGKGTGEISTK